VKAGAKNNRTRGYPPLPGIPIQPLSYHDAMPILAGLEGTLPSAKWQGGLNFTYAIGPGPVRVHMKLSMNFTTTNIWNVIGKISGQEEPDRAIVIGSYYSCSKYPNYRRH
jgi:N-acetylated-alpha-linked acidic dipeptidase